MKKIFFFTLIPSLFLLSCSTPPKQTADRSPTKTRQELETSTKKIAAPVLPEESVIRKELKQFQSILHKKKLLTPEDWKLHDKLLDYYIGLKAGAGEVNTVFVPAKSRWTKNMESFCLDTDKAIPEPLEVFDWIKDKASIPYLHELLSLASRKKDLKTEDIQTIIWNLLNKTNWEEYPKKYQDVLLSIDSNANQKLPSKTKEFIKSAASEVLREYSPIPADEAASFLRGKFYDYENIRSKFAGLKPKTKLLTSVDATPPIPETSFYAETRSHDFSSQEVTFFNPSGEDANGKGLPDSWATKVSKVKLGTDKLQGIEKIHPDNDNIRIRIMPGDPKSKYPNSRKPYIKQKAQNKFFDRNGKVVDEKSEEAHIPLEDYKFFEFWNIDGKK